MLTTDTQLACQAAIRQQYGMTAEMTVRFDNRLAAAAMLQNAKRQTGYDFTVRGEDAPRQMAYDALQIAAQALGCREQCDLIVSQDCRAPLRQALFDAAIAHVCGPHSLARRCGGDDDRRYDAAIDFITVPYRVAAGQLRQARDRIADPDRWCQEQLAVDSRGRSIGPTEPEAAAWCAVGALASVRQPEWEIALAERFLDHAAQARGYPGAADLNDASGTEHSDVLALFDAAAACADGPALLSSGAPFPPDVS